VTHRFGGLAGKLPVRGQIRVTQVLICSALMVNLRLIWRCEQQLAKRTSQKALSFLSRSWLRLRYLLQAQPVRLFPNSALVLAKTRVLSGESILLFRIPDHAVH
jgi:hypothetical protein